MLICVDDEVCRCVCKLSMQLYNKLNRRHFPGKSAGCRTLYGSPRDGDDMPRIKDVGNVIHMYGVTARLSNMVMQNIPL
jgi:hypothetical protein